MNWYCFQYNFIDVITLPDTPMPGKVYVCKEEATAQFICPCGCGAIITLSLLKGHKPCWKIIGNSISPSIHRTEGCKTHFTITNGIAQNNE